MAGYASYGFFQITVVFMFKWITHKISKQFLNELGSIAFFP